MRRLVVVLAVVLCAVTASAQTLITPTAPGPWQFTASASALPAPPASYIAPGFETPPLGIGSVHLAVGQDGNLSAQARNTAYAGTLLSNLTALSYSTFVDVTGSTTDQAPYLNLLIDNDNNGTVDDQLFFEPAYQNGAYSGDPVPNQGTVTPHVWQTWDAMIGGWWALSASTFGPPLVTLSTYIAAHPNATIVNSSTGLGGVRILTGGGAGAWDNFLGAADNVTIDTTTTTPVTYNFEPDAGTVITVTETTPDGWSLQTVDDGDATNTATIDIVPGPATPPLGDGSLQLAVGADGGDAAQARSTNWDGELVRDLSSLTYWTYVDQDGSGGQAPYLLLDVDYNGDGVRDDILFFEPLYQGVTFFPDNPQGPIVLDTWQQWDARSGGWYSLIGVAGSGPGTNVVPLGDILDAEPDARLTGANGGGVRIVAGFGAGAWDNFIGYVDAFSISFDTPTTTYDFEPEPSITIDDLSQSEGTGTTTNFIVTLNLSEAVSQTVTVNYSTADGTATVADGDYTPVASGVATFTPGTTSTTITIVVNADTKFEPNEDFFINLSTPQFATIADPQARIEILNDDSQPTIGIGDLSLSEGNTGIAPATPFTFTVTLSNPSYQNVSVNWATAPDTALTPADFIAGANTLVIPAGSTSGTFTVDVVGDLIDESNEQFFVNLSVPVNATISDPQAVGTIVDDDGAPGITISDVSLAEGNTGSAPATPFTFTVTLTNPSASTVSVDWSTGNGTATTPGDYTGTSGTVTFVPGDVSETITIDVVGDTGFEANETFFVNLLSATGGTITDNQGTGTIINDDGAIADVSITKGAPASALPGSQITYNILVSNAGPQPASNVVVTDTIPAGTTFVSATPSQGTCNFAAGTVTCTLGTLASGASATIALTVVTPATPQTISNTATVANTPEADPTPGNNTSPAAVTALAQPTGIPTVSEWGLIALLAALMAAAVLKLR